MISFRKEETPISSKIYAYSSEETKNNRNIICEYSVGEYIKQEVEKLQQENIRLNNIIKYLKNYCFEHEEYEITKLIEQLESANIEWLENALKENKDE